MERQAKDGTVYQLVGENQWTAVTRKAKDGTVYKKIGDDQWARSQSTPKPSKVESGLRGAAQGASLGYADEMSGATEALWQKAKGHPSEFGRLYKKFRDESRANFGRAQQANPGTYGTAEIGAGIATAFVPGLNIAKGAKLGMVAAKSAGFGALAGGGYSEGETAGEVATDVLVGGALGAGVAGAAPYVGKAIAKAGQGMKGSAERFAARALGAERGTIKKMGQDKVQQAGRYALDEEIISPLATTSKKIARNDAARKRGGEQMSDVYSTLDDAGQTNFNPLDTASKVDDKIGDFYRSPINRGETKQLENTLESILIRGDENILLKTAQKLKKEIAKVANWKNKLNVTEKEQMARDAYFVVSDAIDDAAEKGAKALGKTGLVKKLTAGKKLVSSAKTAEELLENKLAKEQGNNFGSMTDWILFGGSIPGAIASGGTSIPGSLALYGAKKGLEKFGSQNAAIALDKAGKLLTKAPNIAKRASQNPIGTQQVLSKPFRSASSTMPKVANDDSPKKGPTKWANDGLKKIKKHDSSLSDSVIRGALKSKKGRNLLIRASDLKPGSRAMDKIAIQIKKIKGVE